MSQIRPIVSAETPTPDTVPPAAPGPAAPPPPVQSHVREFSSRSDEAVPGPAAPPRTNNLAPRSRTRAPITAAGADNNAILQIVSGLPVYTEVSDSVSSCVVPSSLAFFQVVHTIDNLMATTHRFLQSAPTWHPIVSHLYFSMLFFFQVLRAQREAGELGFHLMELMITIESYFDFRALSVPGPLVHFFAALSVSAPADELFGNVYTGIPSSPSVAASSGFRLLNGLFTRLPDIPLLLDIFTRQVFQRPQAPGPGTTYSFSSIFGQAQDSSTYARYHLRSPNYWYLSDVPDSIWQNCHNSRSLMRVPAALSINQTNINPTWGQFLRLQPIGTESLVDWFSPIITIMQRYSGFFTGSKSLADIPVSSCGALFLEVRYSQDITRLTESDPAPKTKTTSTRPMSQEGSSSTSTGPPIVVENDSPVPDTIVRLPGLSATARHAHRDLPLLHLQLGALSQVNADNFSSFTCPERTGPYWQVRPYYQYINKFDYSRILGGNLVDHYHKDTRQ
nr:capsid protein [Leptosphaeria biglobosa partitivirus 4]